MNFVFNKRICSHLTMLTLIHAKAVRPEQIRLLNRTIRLLHAIHFKALSTLVIFDALKFKELHGEIAQASGWGFEPNAIVG